MANKNVEEFRKRKEAKDAYNLSTKIMKNFKVYFASIKSITRSVFSRIRKDDYEKMQNQPFIDSDFQQDFFSDLPNNDKSIETKTYVLTEKNFAMGFHPKVWKILNLAQKIALCRIARQKFERKDFKQFCVYDTNTVVLTGKKYNGLLNVGALTKTDLNGIDYLIRIANAENMIRSTKFEKKHKFNTITDFETSKLTDYESFEELQYALPIFVPTVNADELSPKNRALFFDDLYLRRSRDAMQTAYDYITEHSTEIADLFPEVSKYINIQQNKIDETNIFIASQLGSFISKRDEEFLRIKVNLYNDYYIREYNSLVDEYNNTQNRLKNAQDLLEKIDCEETLVSLKEKMKVSESKLTTFEKVKEHFKKHFEQTNSTDELKTKKDKKNIPENNTKKDDVDFEKVN